MLNQLEVSILKALNESVFISRYGIAQAVGHSVSVGTLCDMGTRGLVTEELSVWGITDAGKIALRKAQAVSSPHPLPTPCPTLENAVSATDEGLTVKAAGYSVAHGGLELFVSIHDLNEVMVEQFGQTLYATPAMLRALADKAEELV